MAFSRFITTTKGHELTAKILAGEVPTIGQTPFTRIVTSEAVYQLGQLESLTGLDQIRQETLVSEVRRKNKTTISIHGRVDNSELAVGYRFNTFGVFFNCPTDGVEYLFGSSIFAPEPNVPQADFIHPFNGQTTTGITFNAITGIGNADNISLTVDPAAVVTVGALDLVRQNLQLQSTELLRQARLSQIAQENAQCEVGEIGTVVLTNTHNYPFNNSERTVVLAQPRNSTDYTVQIISATATGGFDSQVGRLRTFDNLVNGFKITFTGSAPRVEVRYIVQGGMS